MKPQPILDKIMATPRNGKRRVLAIAGPPASGKSTLAETLAKELCAVGCQTQVVPMDGFHLDNDILKSRNLFHRKGAPETFDVHGFLTLAKKLGSDDNVTFPIFDRDRDTSIADAGIIGADCDTIIVEGNYVLLDAPDWRDLKEFWDLSIFIGPPETTLLERLVQRWLDQGMSLPDATARAQSNDLANARLVLENTDTTDVWVIADR